MHITNIKAQNFRLIKSVNLELSKNKQDLSLLIGKNNSGKTSFIVLLEKFLSSAKPNFGFDDFPIGLRSKILGIDEKTDTHELAISLLLDIHYNEDDSLGNIADFILDLDPAIHNVKILFECTIKQKSFLNDLKQIEDRKNEYIQKHISNFLETSIYAVSDESDINVKSKRHKLVKKEWKSVDFLINLQVIHAKRNVASSESTHGAKKVLSTLTTEYFNKENKLSHDDQNGLNKSIIAMDVELDKHYKIYFERFLKTSKDFLNIQDLNVVSDLQSKGILENHSKIIYGDVKSQLPEHLNGLGYMNILFLLLQIEIKKSHFSETKKDVNLLFIEEPEAHTHPQMQYVFIEKIKKLLLEIPHLQTMISTHSSHIVNKCDFKEIRYFLKLDDGGIEIKNFYSDLAKKYKDEQEQFKFLQQYLTLNSSELFFAEKIIFIEGTAEKLLLPLFIKKLDDKNADDSAYNPLSSQNISILEVGANARVFRHFLDFLNIKTLIITDIDTTKLEPTDKKDRSGAVIEKPKACPVVVGTHTSNCVFWPIPITDSGFSRSPILEHADH